MARVVQQHRFIRIAALSIGVTILGSTAPGSSFARPGRPHAEEVVSVSSSGEAADGDSGAACGGDWTTHWITPSGRFVAYSSAAQNLSPGDSNKAPDIFVRDRKKNKTEVVSLASNGVLAAAKDLASTISGECNFGSTRPSMSSSGRFVAFESNAPLVLEDTNTTDDIYVHDRKLGSTELITGPQDLTGTLLDTIGQDPSISADGTLIAYMASDSVLGTQIALYDRKLRDSRIVSVNDDGESADAAARAPSLSGNGRYVLFYSEATNLVDTSPAPLGAHVYLRDLKTGRTELVSLDVNGNPANSPATRGSNTTFGTNFLSGNGRFVMFASFADGIVPNDNRTTIKNAEPVDVFIFDRKLGRTEKATVNSSGGLLNGNLEHPSLSTDGRFVVFKREFAGASATKPNGCDQPCDGVYVHDRLMGSTESVGELTDSQVRFPVISGHGREVAFVGKDDRSPASDRNGFLDIVLYDRGLPLGAGEIGKDPSRNAQLSLAGSPRFGRSGMAILRDDHSDAAVPAPAGGVGELLGAQIAHRPLLGDLYLTLDVESMPPTPTLAAATAGTLYGWSFAVDGRSYEVRISSTGIGFGGTTTAAFALLSCSGADQPMDCIRVADLDGGFGTTGERVTVSIPLEEITGRGGRLHGIRAFTAIGSIPTGALRLIDEISLASPR